MHFTLLYMSNEEIAGIAAVLIVFLLIIFWKPKVNVSTNSVNAFVEHQFPVQEFYARVTELITRREMPDVKIKRVNFPVASMLSEQREYLRISRKDSIYDICTAPFGTGSFVSCWYGEPRKTLKALMRKVATTYIKNPDVHQIMDNFENKTRFQYDTDSVFRAWVEDCLKEAINEMLETKGTRISPEKLARLRSDDTH